jgi:hypothetical protein
VTTAAIAYRRFVEGVAVRDLLLSATPLPGTLLMIATKNLTRFGSPEG